MPPARCWPAAFTGRDATADAELTTVDVSALLDAPCAAGGAVRSSRGPRRYPSWLDLVHRPSPTAPETAREAAPRRGGSTCAPASARSRRSKRLRMERVEHDPDRGDVRFERHELDGRRHAPWVLTAEVTPRDDGSTLTMHLHYGGKLWTGGVLERALSDQIQQGRERLLTLTAPTH